MKRKTTRFLGATMLAVCLLAGLCASALAQEYTAQAAQGWLGQFALALQSLEPLNDPAQTVDPARAGEYLYEYDFGTVTATNMFRPSAQSILAIDVRTPQVTDCMGLRVGMSLEDALGGMQTGASSTQLYVLRLPVAQMGWSWAYVSADGVYGVEHIAYGEDAAQMTEYTLTYVIKSGVISAIRMRIAPATQAQAMEGMATAKEIAARQHGEVLAEANNVPAFKEDDNCIAGGRALGEEAAALVARIGEPQQIQTLPDGGGRILLYEDAVITLGLDEYTGVERVRGVSVSGGLEGPRGLAVAMSVQEACSLFRCDNDVSSLGGALYLEGEAYGEAPCGMLIAAGAGDMILSYACFDEGMEEIVLEAGVRNGEVAYWRLYYAVETEETNQ